MLRWVLRAPEHGHAWLWLHLLPTLLLHVPARGVGRGRGPKALSRAARLAAILDGRFGDALADRDVGVWRTRLPGTVDGGRGGALPVLGRRGGGSAPAAPTSPHLNKRQRRALRRLARGQVGGCMQTLTGDAVAAESDAVLHKARGLFPPATPDLATAESVAATFRDGLAAATAFGEAEAIAPATAVVPPALDSATIVAAIRSAARGKAPGPSGLRMEHLWALHPAGRDALVRVVQLLASAAAVDKLPPVVRRMLASGNLLLLVKKGGVDEAGVPGLRPIGMPETLRKLVGSALMAAVMPAARRFLTPLQRAIGTSGACEVLIHEVDALMALHPEWGVLQLDFTNAFNRISAAAAWKVLRRTLPLLDAYYRLNYRGGPTPVYGWAQPVEEGEVPVRLTLLVARGVQQGNPLGPLLHTLALHLLLLELAARHPDCAFRGMHDGSPEAPPPRAAEFPAGTASPRQGQAGAGLPLAAWPATTAWPVSGRGGGPAAPPLDSPPPAVHVGLDPPSPAPVRLREPVGTVASAPPCQSSGVGGGGDSCCRGACLCVPVGAAGPARP
eukprot:TRINITY_DN1905_c0_g1_i1.p1 TRINITY_DN1905_c0_g1~~TRINITY_DN1905_c0_g1_i1.p1  ORF type:complete len:559 (+),score=61.63 TRINITY_DN1905_c0_g1_i1:580-2256(+)